MNVIKRSGIEQEFDIQKIRNAISRANSETQELSEEATIKIINYVLTECNKYKRALNVEEIQEIVENALMKYNKFKTAKAYIKYRYQKTLNRNQNTTDKQILATVNLENEEVKQENANKNPILLSTQRDYIAGLVSRDLTNRYFLPKEIQEAHREGLIHFHDADYFVQKMHNCDLINLDDMLQNGTVINGVKIEKPHSFLTACTIMTQIMAIVASSQYGGQTMTLSHIAPFVDVSRQKIKARVKEDLKELKLPEDKIDNIVETRVKEEIKKGVQTLQYQILTLSSTNGQSPFVSLEMYLDEVEEGRLRDDLALVIEEVLNQRIQGVKNEQGVWITPAFPKLLYVLDEDNINENSKYYYLTKLAAKCTAKRMVPDYISAKVMKELKGDVYPCMGAVRGDEKVSIKVNDVEFDDIAIKDAFNIIRAATPIHGGDFPVNSSLKKRFFGKCGVYKITHIPTGKYYIGSSKNIYRRLIEHKTKCAHMGTLGELYFINDFNPDNFKYELLKECSIDDLWNVEAEFIDLTDPSCVNHKDSRNNGNFDSINRNKALNKESYSDYTGRAYTWFKDVSKADILIKSKNDWQKVLKITFNDHRKCPLKLFDISFKNSEQQIQHIHCTEDHPLHTTRGRVEAKDLKIGDKIYSFNLSETYEVMNTVEDTEKYDTYDFEVDNDVFNLSGILSHNCRSFLTPDRFSEKVGNIANSLNYKEGKHVYFSRFNQGVVTLNLVDIACSSKKNIDKFWKIFDERCELAHKALRIRHEHLLGTPSDVAPILWQYGALARLEKGEKIDKLLYNGYSTISLGYAGLWETVYYMTGKKLTEEEGKEFGLEIMKKLNEYTEKWKLTENIDYSLYGTPLESSTYRLAQCLQRRFGIIKGVTDKNYITNSYHVHVTEPIDAFSKLKLESEFQKLSPGGAISYVEVPNLTGNIEAVLSVIKFIYDNIMYAELNTKSDYCQVCGYDGEIQLIDDKNGKHIWRCPQCGNTDHNKMNVARRTCGYIGTNDFNQGRLEEIKERVLHL